MILIVVMLVINGIVWMLVLRPMLARLRRQREWSALWIEGSIRDCRSWRPLYRFRGSFSK